MTPTNFSRAVALAMLLAGSASADAQTVDPESFDFGIVAVGDVSPQQTFVLTNTMPGPIQLDDVVLDGQNTDQFEIQANDCVGELLSGASCETRVVFSPTVAGDALAALVFLFFDGNGVQSRALSDLAGSTPIQGMEEADLALALSLDSSETAPGQGLLLSIDVSNLGPDLADAVAMDIVFPPEATEITAGNAGWVCALAASTLSCTRTELAASADAPLDVQFNAPAAPGQYEIAGTVASQTVDPVLSNNQDSIQFGVVDEPPPPPPAVGVPVRVPTLASHVLAALILLVVALAWTMRAR